MLDPDYETGSVGDYDNDFYQFVRWVVEATIPDFKEGEFTQDKKNTLYNVGEKLRGRSAASFSMIRSLAISEGVDTEAGLKDLIEDVLEPDIKKTRRYQELQALMNCTRLSLLPKPSKKDEHSTVEMRRDGVVFPLTIGIPLRRVISVPFATVPHQITTEYGTTDTEVFQSLM